MEIEQEIKKIVQIEYTVNDIETPFASIITLEEEVFDNLEDGELQAIQEAEYSTWKLGIEEGV
jgi:hypothetical protein